MGKIKRNVKAMKRALSVCHMLGALSFLLVAMSLLKIHTDACSGPANPEVFFDESMRSVFADFIRLGEGRGSCSEKSFFAPAWEIVACEAEASRKTLRVRYGLRDFVLYEFDSKEPRFRGILRDGEPSRVSLGNGWYWRRCK